MRVLVTGGSGQLGKELKPFFPDAMFVYSKEFNLLNQIQVHKLLSETKPDLVIHTAARVGGIIDNMANQFDYFTDNTLMNTNLISKCVDFGVKRFIGILSTCAYADISNKYPMSEDMLYDGKPTQTNFSYAMAKRGMAVQIDSIRSSINTNYCYLIPSNLYGPNEKFSEKSHFVAGIFDKIVKARKNKHKEIVLLGTGKPLRQLLFARDLAFAIKRMTDEGIYENLNISNPTNMSIDDYAKLILKVMGLDTWKVLYDNSKPDGQFRKDVDISRFLHYFPNFEFTGLDSGFRQIARKL